MKRFYQQLIVLFYCVLCLTGGTALAQASKGFQGPVTTITIDGPINPATNDFLRTSIAKASELDSRLLVVTLNTPGGLLPSMQKMVEALLEAPLPVAVFVSPSGGGAVSAGVFVTMAAHVAAMAPGTTIGAAHPVLGTGGDIKGDMRMKIENFTVALITAIAEQRNRNARWAERAVRESVSITDREAVEENVVDLVAADVDRLLEKIEGRTVQVNSNPVVLSGLSSAPRQEITMSIKQEVVNILADPNVAVLLGLAAMIGLGIELYHPGAILPGVIGAICLILSLTSAQVLPISYGGLGLLLLGMLFFGVEIFVPSFGIWGVAGIVCFVLGAIYFIDDEMVWSGKGFGVNPYLVGGFAAFGGMSLLTLVTVAVRVKNSKVATGREGMIGERGRVIEEFVSDNGQFVGRVEAMGSIWKARAQTISEASFERGVKIVVRGIEPGMVLVVEAIDVVESVDVESVDKKEFV